MRQSKQIGLLLVLFFLSVSQAGAWEFSMTGNFTWEYYQFSQLGDKGFFGPYNQDNSSVKGTVRLAARNGWLGHEVASRPLSASGDDLASGSDVAANYMYTIFSPRVIVNDALSLQGSYRIGSWLDPTVDFSAAKLSSSRYLNSQAPGIGQSFSPGYWQVWYVQANLPWGTVQIGKQPNTIGLGTIIDSLENASESVCLGIPFGPFSISLQYYVWGPGVNADSGSSNYPLKTDRSGAAQPHFAALLMYGAGNISSQTYIEYRNGHKGPESLLLGPVFATPKPGDPPKTPIFSVVSSDFFGFTNFRYFNGRFFFNAEVGFVHQVYRQNGIALNSSILTQFSPLPQTRYWELWTGVIECGAVAGPAKISFLWAYYPGFDRRGGKLIDRQPGISALLSPDGGVNLYFPYSLLLGYAYGAGNGSISRSSNHGFITDASTYGVRLDYAVAANLNAYATFLYASRVSQGYGWGWIRPNPLTIDSPALQYGVYGVPNIDVLPGPNLVDLSFAGANNTSGLIPAPNILERDLGYEIGGGIDWKLIEGYTLTARVAYWKPGGWFKYACVDRRQPNWDSAPTASNMWGINPNREIDPIFGMRVTLQVDF
ncbi:MAG: hypothetical protein FJ118_12165 [Deltaproteobacteria bacterium]|nr:hypothetical protein [Deltaproteobacteria bacterium]